MDALSILIGCTAVLCDGEGRRGGKLVFIKGRENIICSNYSQIEVKKAVIPAFIVSSPLYGCWCFPSHTDDGGISHKHPVKRDIQ